MNQISRIFFVIAMIVLPSAALADPQRIISLSPSSTEMLFAIGAGNQVVAVDNWSNYPQGVPTTDLSGFEPNLEAIASFEPDLVVISGDRNDIVAGLTAIDIEVLISPAPADFDQVYQQFIELGQATGHVDEAQKIVGQMKLDIEEIIASVPQVSAPLRVYHELGSTFYSASSASFIGKIYQALGLENIADEADVEGYGYPQLSVEYIMQANPELIIVPMGSGYDESDIADRAGWDQLDAVKYNGIILVDRDIASRWGPRVVDYFRLVAEQIGLLSDEMKEAA